MSTDRCGWPDCPKPPKYGKDGLCGAHYEKRRHLRHGDHIKNTAGADLGVRVTELRLALETASARITQALLLLEHPELIARTGHTPAELLIEALADLDCGRQSPHP